MGVSVFLRILLESVRPDAPAYAEKSFQERRLTMKKKILVVDPERRRETSACSMLSNDYDVICASSGEEAVRLYERESPDLVLTDLNIPNMSGFELQRILQERHKELIPMMFISSGGNEEKEIKRLEGGAFDYIRRPFKQDTLLWRVGNIMRHMDRIQTLQLAADTDPMTGLFNKAYARRVLTDLCSRAVGMLMMVDLDNFKLVNDLYGHTMGDRVLIRFAEILRSVIRGADVAGRMGGDEFMIFCKDVREDSAVAEKTRQINEALLASAKEYMGADMKIPLGASVGAIPVPDEGTDFADLYQKADKALYQVKRNGKHGWSVYRSGAVRQDGGEEADPDTLAHFARVLEERNRQPGAYKLDFESFQTVFRYLMRSAENYGRAVQLALFTLTPYPNGRRKGRLSMETVERFSETLGASLRRSDAYTRSGPGQFLVIFAESDGENERVIIDRILRNWDRSGYGNSVLLSYETRVAHI